ncbi:MAG: TRAP transporter fused permease subunit [bacterium]|nr:TRAP transporter fused permease subunit [bacterium]
MIAAASREKAPKRLIQALSVALCLFTLAEVNYPQLMPPSQLAIFAGLGLVLCFLHFPVHRRFRDSAIARGVDYVLSAATVSCCGYIVVQSEPAFERFWLSGQSLGHRAGAEVGLDYAVGLVGLVLILEATRRAVGLALPILALLFLAYAHFGSAMPDWLFPHRGYGIERIVAQSFLHSQGVFGIALRVMFIYVFLFVVFGALLELTGATRFIITYARRLFRGSTGAPAKVSILSSGLMGSLSGSAVANTATTGTFTIPLMRSSGLKAHVAAGIEAAASSGGALVPPVMGAGAYMMLEIIDPPVTYLEIIRAAILPAVLYYLSLFLIAHFSSRSLTREEPATEPATEGPATGTLEGWIFFVSLGSLIAFLLGGSTVFRAVSLAMGVTVALSFLAARTRISPRRALEALVAAARNGIALVAAAASVGIVLGVVTLTGVGTKLPATILPLAQENLFLALLLVMVSSIVLGMGLPSAVCYLLLATLIGPALGKLGVVPLAAHMFIFYFGLMSMVTPPVALAAYTAASIAGSGIMRTAFAAFRFAVIGFALPFVFVYRPQLLMLSPDGGPATWWAVAVAFCLVGAGIVPLAAGIAGHLRRPLGPISRILLLVAAGCLFYPGEAGLLGELPVSPVNLVGAALLLVVGIVKRWSA